MVRATSTLGGSGVSVWRATRRATSCPPQDTKVCLPPHGLGGQVMKKPEDTTCPAALSVGDCRPASRVRCAGLRPPLTQGGNRSEATATRLARPRSPLRASRWPVRLPFRGQLGRHRRRSRTASEASADRSRRRSGSPGCRRRRTPCRAGSLGWRFGSEVRSRPGRQARQR